MTATELADAIRAVLAAAPPEGLEVIPQHDEYHVGVVQHRNADGRAIAWTPYAVVEDNAEYDHDARHVATLIAQAPALLAVALPIIEAVADPDPEAALRERLAKWRRDA